MDLWLGLLLAAAATVKQDNTPLRAGACDVDADIVGRLAAAAEVDIKFAIAGGSEPCYKVVVSVEGQPRTGYLPASALNGATEFERARKQGGAVDASEIQANAAAGSIRRALSANAPSGPALQQASMLIEANQPGAALELLEPIIKQRSTDPDVYKLAGYAAWRNDQPRDALEYWKTSLDLRPDAGLKALSAKVEREAAGDKSGEKLIGLRVMLRYERDMMPLAVAKQMIEVLDAEVSRMAAQIGCPTGERLVAIVQSRDAYFQTTQAAEWSGGQYNGRIRVPYDPARTPASMQRLFAHETVHACLANLGTWPPWLHEGLAQKFSGDTLRPEMREKIKSLAAKHALPKLDDFRRDWSGLNTENATIAYGVSLAAAELLFENYPNTGLLNLLRNPNLMAQVTAELNRKLGLE